MRGYMFGFIFLIITLSGYGQESLDSLWVRASRFYAQGDYISSSNLLRKGLSIEPGNTLFELGMAQNFAFLNKPDSLYYYCDRVIERGDSMAYTATLVKSKMIISQGNVKKATELLEPLKFKYVPLSSTYSLLAYCYLEQKKFAIANYCINDALILNPYDPDNLNLLLKILLNSELDGEALLVYGFFYLFIDRRDNFLFNPTEFFTPLLQFYGDPDNLDEVKQLISYNPDYSSSAYSKLAFFKKMKSFILSRKKLVKPVSDEEWNARTLIYAISQLEYVDFDELLIKKYYLPLFVNMVKSGHSETFCWLLQGNESEQLKTWQHNHQKEIQAYIDWANQVVLP